MSARGLVFSILCFSALLCYYLFATSQKSPEPHARFDTQLKHKGAHARIRRDRLEHQQQVSPPPTLPASNYIAPPRAGLLRQDHREHVAAKASLEKEAAAAQGDKQDDDDRDFTESDAKMIELFVPDWIVNRYLTCDESSTRGGETTRPPPTYDDGDEDFGASFSDPEAHQIDGACVNYTQRYSDCLWIREHLSRKKQQALFSRVGFRQSEEGTIKSKQNSSSSSRHRRDNDAGGGRELVLLRVGGGGKKSKKKKTTTTSSSSSSSSGVSWPEDRWLSTCSLVLESSQCGHRHVFLYVLEGEEHTAVPPVFSGLVRTHPDRELRDKFGSRSNNLYSRGGPYQRGDLAAAYFLTQENKKKQQQDDDNYYSSKYRLNNNSSSSSSSSASSRRLALYEFAWVVEGDVRFAGGGGGWDRLFHVSKVLGRVLPDATVADDDDDKNNPNPLAPTPGFQLSAANAALQQVYDNMFPASSGEVSQHVIRTGSLVRTGKNPAGQLFSRRGRYTERVAGVLRMLENSTREEARRHREREEERLRRRRTTRPGPRVFRPNNSWTSAPDPDDDDGGDEGNNNSSEILPVYNNTAAFSSASTFGFNSSAGDAHLIFFAPPIRNYAGYFDPLRAKFLGSEYNFAEYAAYHQQETKKAARVMDEEAERREKEEAQRMMIKNGSKKEKLEILNHPLPLMVPPPNTWHFTRRKHFFGRWFDKFDDKHLKKKWIGALMPAFGFSAEFAELLVAETLKGDGHVNQEVDLTGLALLRGKKMVTTAGVLNSQFYFAAQHHEWFVPRTAPLYLQWRGVVRNSSSLSSLSRGNRLYEGEKASTVYGIGTNQFRGGSCLAGVLFHPVKDI